MSDSDLDCIEYAGINGITQSCINGAMRYLQEFDDPVTEAKVITYNKRHAFILFTDERRKTIVVRAGFGSGYQGEGSSGFGYMLSRLDEFKVEIVEYDVPERFFQRLNNGQLTYKDLQKLEAKHPVRPHRIFDYIHEYSFPARALEKRLPLPIPLRLVDERIRDLAIDFWTAPGDRILTGFKRLEELVRKRCEIEEHGAKVFSRAFMGGQSILEWEELQTGEQTGRAQLFTGAYSGFRNPRAHREFESSDEDLFSEFLTLNQLYRLESKATTRELLGGGSCNRRYQSQYSNISPGLLPRMGSGKSF